MRSFFTIFLSLFAGLTLGWCLTGLMNWGGIVLFFMLVVLIVFRIRRAFQDAQ